MNSKIPRALSKLLPFSLKIELLRLARLPAFLLERGTVAKTRLGQEKCRDFGFVVAQHKSPLRRASVSDERLQRGKERNVTLAASFIDGLLIEPSQLFSYHHLVGRPSRLRGFRDGLELRNGRTDKGVGGGCCQVSNLLYWLSLNAGMKITERHRHGLDLFPDHERTVPFGCGATVFYNYADLRFENPLPLAVLLRLGIQDGQLTGSLCTRDDPGFRVEISERGHRFFQDEHGWIRENRIVRRITRPDGSLILEQTVAHNRGRVCYQPDLSARE